MKNNKLVKDRNINKRWNQKVMTLLMPLCLFFFSQAILSQDIKTSVDSTSIKIGEEVKLQYLVDVENTDLVVFPEAKAMGLMEVIESYKIDTLNRSESRFSLKKEYGLTQFDSGTYAIPPQKIIINGKTFTTDSLLIEVRDVVVDTTKQKMYDIKPIVEVEEPSQGIPMWVLYVLLGLAALVGLLYLIFFRKTKKEREEENKLPPFEEAILHLKELDNSDLLDSSQYKKYYSELTDVLKRYLDEEIYDNALESTSDELITKLELLRDSGELPMSRETILELRKVLQTSDLVKFAKSQPDQGTAKVDRSTIEAVINEAKEALPEPTEEELLLNEQYRLEQEQKRKKRKIIYASITGFAVIVLTFVGFGIKYGFDQVKDNIIGHPTKELLEGDWVRSEYGNPAIVVTTPKVLKRVSNDQLEAMKMQSFAYGSMTSNFALIVNTTQVPETAQVAIGQTGESEDEEEETPAIDLEQVNEMSLKMFEEQGASDIIVKQGEYETPKGLSGMKAYGSMTIENPLTKKKQQTKYEILSFSQESALQQLVIFYQEGDNYASQIVEKVLESVELKKSEE